MAFCFKCGNQLQDGAVFCSNCGTRIDGAANTKSEEEEKVLLEGLCNRIKSKFNVQNGHGLLTNKRFIYNKHSLAKIAAIGLLVNFTKGTYDFDIKLSDIKEVKDGRQGVSKTIIFVNRYGEEYNFYIKNRQKWVIELTNLLGREKVRCSL